MKITYSWEEALEAVRQCAMADHYSIFADNDNVEVEIVLPKAIQRLIDADKKRKQLAKEEAKLAKVAPEIKPKPTWKLFNTATGDTVSITKRQVHKFCKERKLEVSHVRSLIRGEFKAYKGWIIIP